MSALVDYLSGLLGLRFGHRVNPDGPQTRDGRPVLDVTVRRLNATEEVNLAQAYAGKVVLVVNTASQCGFTPQYQGLNTLYREYRERGLVVLGFPSNDFANQEPGDETTIAQFCQRNYGVDFPMFAKSHVRRANADPLFRRLAEAAGEYPEWNFHKYLIDREGRLVGSYASMTRVQSKKLTGRIISLL